MSDLLDAVTEAEAAANGSADSSEKNWLAAVEFHSSASSDLREAAERGDAEQFAAALRGQLKELAWKKRKRGKILTQLAQFWPRAAGRVEAEIDPASLAHCLFDEELTADELSGRIEAILAASTGGRPDRETLLAALWLLRTSANRLDSQTLLALWRWTFENCVTFIRETANENTPAGFAKLEVIEIQWLAGAIYRPLRRLRDGIRRATHAVLPALDTETDTDGTPHARALEQVFPVLMLLARMQLFATELDRAPWGGKANKRIQGLFRRAIPLLHEEQRAFIGAPGPNRSLLQGLAAVLGADVPEEQSRSRRICHQSDWGEWGCLRSADGKTVDQLLVRYDRPVPEISALVRGTPFLQGGWGHSLRVNGDMVAASSEWNCVCWYSDKQAAYIELEQRPTDQIRVIRQALLVRGESVLVVADSVRTGGAERLEWTRSLPLVPGWSFEEDSETRELALFQDRQRVRVFPWSAPQLKVHRSDEQTTVRDGRLTVAARGDGPNLGTATMFDWNPKRRETPVEWCRVSVVEDGRTLPTTAALGFRLRIGKQQWLLYHSFVPPTIPRSVMGVHTGSETIIAQIDAQGDAETLVEVEL